MHLNHPETIHHSRVCGKIVLHETCPWCQKGWGSLLKSETTHQIKTKANSAKPPFRSPLKEQFQFWCESPEWRIFMVFLNQNV